MVDSNGVLSILAACGAIAAFLLTHLILESRRFQEENLKRAVDLGSPAIRAVVLSALRRSPEFGTLLRKEMEKADADAKESLSRLRKWAKEQVWVSRGYTIAIGAGFSVLTWTLLGFLAALLGPPDGQWPANFAFLSALTMLILIVAISFVYRVRLMTSDVLLQLAAEGFGERLYSKLQESAPAPVSEDA